MLLVHLYLPSVYTEQVNIYLVSTEKTDSIESTRGTQFLVSPFVSISNRTNNSPKLVFIDHLLSQALFQVAHIILSH